MWALAVALRSLLHYSRSYVIATQTIYRQDRMAAERFSARDLETFAARVLQARGMREPDAATVARVLLWAELRGIDSHGLLRLPQYVEFIETGEVDPLVTP